VFARALAVDIGERFSNIGQFWGELRKAAQMSPLEATGHYDLKKLLSPEKAQVEPPDSPGPSQEKLGQPAGQGGEGEAAGRRQTTTRGVTAEVAGRPAGTWRWAAIGVGAAALLAAGAWAYATQQSDDSPRWVAGATTTTTSASGRATTTSTSPRTTQFVQTEPPCPRVGEEVVVERRPEDRDWAGALEAFPAGNGFAPRQQLRKGYRDVVQEQRDRFVTFQTQHKMYVPCSILRKL
jgi:hypothetical protein